MITGLTLAKVSTFNSQVKLSDFKQTLKKLGDMTLRDDDAFSFGSDPASEGHVTAIKILDNGVINKKTIKPTISKKPSYVSLYEESGKKRSRLQQLSNTMMDIQ